MAYHWNWTESITAYSPQCYLTVNNSVSFFLLYSFYITVLPIAEKVVKTSSHRGRSNWTAGITHLHLSAAEEFPILVPQFCIVWKSWSSQASFAQLLLFFFNVVFNELYYRLQKPNKPINFQDNKLIGKLGSKECWLQHT